MLFLMSRLLIFLGLLELTLEFQFLSLVLAHDEILVKMRDLPSRTY